MIGNLGAENRWVKMSIIVPWDLDEEIYARTFKYTRTDVRPPMTSRIAFGALYIKDAENLSQRYTVQHLTENVYMQYFIGMTKFNPKPPFEAAMLIQFVMRFEKKELRETTRKYT